MKNVVVLPGLGHVAAQVVKAVLVHLQRALSLLKGPKYRSRHLNDLPDICPAALGDWPLIAGLEAEIRPVLVRRFRADEGAEVIRIPLRAAAASPLPRGYDTTPVARYRCDDETFVGEFLQKHAGVVRLLLTVRILGDGVGVAF
jgi:hypothetical protein